MKIASRITTALIAATFAGTLSLSGASFNLKDGSQIEGEIAKVRNNQVTIAQADGSKTVCAFAELDAAGQKAIKSWKRDNPEKSDVFLKWDKQPVILSNAMPRLPEQLRSGTFKGMTSVELVLDEKGQVLHASINKSTHAELEGPSIEATKAWKFEPAEVDGKAVKSKLRVPFNFTYVEPEPEHSPIKQALVPYLQQG